jgi:hypothetical protein
MDDMRGSRMVSFGAIMIMLVAWARPAPSPSEIRTAGPHLG